MLFFLSCLLLGGSCTLWNFELCDWTELLLVRSRYPGSVLGMLWAFLSSLCLLLAVVCSQIVASCLVNVGFENSLITLFPLFSREFVRLATAVGLALVYCVFVTRSDVIFRVVYELQASELCCKSSSDILADFTPVSSAL